MITVKHRRASENEWLECDPVIPDGELALVSDGRGYDIKIGDGVKHFSELSPIMGRHIDDEREDADVKLRHRDHVCLCLPYALKLDLSEATRGDYVAMLSLTTDYSAPELTIEYNDDIVFSGTDIEDGVFVPQGDKRYTLLFWRDSMLNCHVRGAYAP